MSYASDTEISVEKTEAQIKAMLLKAGAKRFMTLSDDARAGLAFELNGKQLRFILPLPDPNEERFTHKKTGTFSMAPRDKAGQYKAWEQACRSRWRGLFLNIKAKLEAVEIGITTFESEFLAHFMLPSGHTVGEEMLPRLEEVTSKPGTPLLMQ